MCPTWRLRFFSSSVSSGTLDVGASAAAAAAMEGDKDSGRCEGVWRDDDEEFAPKNGREKNGKEEKKKMRGGKKYEKNKNCMGEFETTHQSCAPVLYTLYLQFCDCEVWTFFRCGIQKRVRRQKNSNKNRANTQKKKKIKNLHADAQHNVNL